MIRSILALGLGLSLVACGGDPEVEPPPPAEVADSPEEAPSEAAPEAAPSAADLPPPDGAGMVAGQSVAGQPAAGTQAQPPEVEITPPSDIEEDLVLPSFSSLIGSGPAVTITVTIEGATQGELAFQSIGASGAASMLHVQPATGSTVAVKAPASYPDPIYVSITVPEDPTAGLDSEAGRAQGTPERRGAGMQVGGAEQPVTLAGDDVAVTVVAGKAPSWLEKLATQGIKEEGGERAR